MAAVVAALGDLQISIVCRRTDDTLAAQREVLLHAVALEVVFTVEQARHDGVDGLVGRTADDRIDLGDLLLDLAAVTLGQTAGDDDFQVRVCLLIGAGVQNVLDGLGLRALDEAAGVDEDDICFAQLCHRLVAC